MSHVLIIAAKSDIARSLARVYADEGFDLYLAARNCTDLEDLTDEIKTHAHRDAECLELDILDFESHEVFYRSLAEKPVGVITVVGYLGEQELAQIDFSEARLILDTNYTGVTSLLNIIANDFEQRKDGFIIGVSSVAGDRGRQSNYIYGAAKAALTAYLSGLRNRLQSSGVSVLTVKPGYVATRMTAGMELPAILTADPDTVAKQIRRAQKRNRSTLYVKRVWRWIMAAVKSIPESIFKRMRL